MSIENVSFEELLLELFEYQVTSELLLEERLNQEDPHFLNRNDCLSASGIESDDKIHYFPKGIRRIVKSNYGLTTLADLSPDSVPQIALYLFILMQIIHVL